MKIRSIGLVTLFIAGVVVACTPGAVAPPSVGPPSVAPASVAPPSVAPPIIATAPAPGASAVPTQPSEPGEGTALLPDPSADHTIGETITLSDFYDEEQAAITVLEAIQRPQSDASGGPEYAFLVEIEGLASSIHYNVLQFSMFDDESFEYMALSGRHQPELNFGDLANGRKVRGWLTFAGPDSSEYTGAPVGAHHGRLDFRACAGPLRSSFDGL